MPCTKIKSGKYLKRPSPPYHAGECKNKVKRGNDGQKWISAQNSRGVYVWRLYNVRNEVSRDIKRKVISKIKEAFKILRKNGIFTVFVKGKVAVTDYWWDEAEKRFEKHYGKKFNFLVDNILQTPAEWFFKYNKPLVIYQMLTDKAKRELVYSVFRKIFGRKMKWNKSQYKGIVVYYGGGLSPPTSPC